MSLYDRAAQFAPFAALTGHDAVIHDAAVRHLADVDAITMDGDPIYPLSEDDFV